MHITEMQSMLNFYAWARTLLVSTLLFIVAPLAVADALTLGEAERIQLLGLETLQGEQLKTTDFENKAVIITFFASWCPPCLDEFHDLNTIAKEYQDSALTIIAINVFEEFDNNDKIRMSRFLDNTQPQFSVVKGNARVKQMFGDVQRIPTLLVFDRGGNSVMHFIHARGAKKRSVTDSELRIALSRALK